MKLDFASVGAIVPMAFKVLDLGAEPAASSLFQAFNKDLFSTLAARNRLFGTDHKWITPLRSFFFRNAIDSINLSHGKEFKNVNFSARIDYYQGGYAALSFWIELSNKKAGSVTEYRDLVELGMLIRSSGEVIDSENRYSVALAITWNGYPEIFGDFKKFIDRLEEMLPFGHSSFSHSSTSFVYPMFHLGNLDGLSKLDQEHLQFVRGLSMLWPYDPNLIRPNWVTSYSDSQFHPYTHGIANYTVACGIEALIGDVTTILERDKWSAAELIHYERETFQAVTQIGILQMFILKMFDAKIVNLIADFRKDLDGYSILRQRRSKRILQGLELEYMKHATLINGLSNFHFTTREYLPKIIHRIHSIFGVAKIEDSIKTNLALIREYIVGYRSRVYGQYLMILTVIATLGALLQCLLVILH